MTVTRGIDPVNRNLRLMISAEWRGKVTAGQKLTFQTVLVPLPEGTTSPPNGLTLGLEAGHASVKFGAFSYAFPSEK